MNGHLGEPCCVEVSQGQSVCGINLWGERTTENTERFNNDITSARTSEAESVPGEKLIPDQMMWAVDGQG